MHITLVGARPKLRIILSLPLTQTVSKKPLQLNLKDKPRLS